MVRRGGFIPRVLQPRIQHHKINKFHISHMRNVNLKEENFAGTLKKSLLIIALIWTAAVALSLFWNISQIKENVINEAYSDAKMASHKDVLYRQWGARHSGVYVPVTPETPPNPYLSHIPERDITTPSGKKLTLVNPAYMTRQVYELEGRKYGLIGRLTSPRPISPQNAPDEWEKKAFFKISHGENGFFSVLDMNGTKVLRLMTPFFVEESCMACHARQGYKPGELRGGISIAINMEPLLERAGRRILTISLTHALMWAMTLILILLGYRKLMAGERQRSAVQKDREKLIVRLEDSLARVQTLSGMLPICASCKNVRNDKGYWERIEKYISERTAAEFTHGLCPECRKKLYPDLEENQPQTP